MSVVALADPYCTSQGFYASTILYLFTLFLAKASTLLLIARMARVSIHLLAVRVVSGLVLLWTAASTLAVAFQCQLPHPWDYIRGICFDPVCAIG